MRALERTFCAGGVLFCVLACIIGGALEGLRVTVLAPPINWWKLQLGGGRAAISS